MNAIATKDDIALLGKYRQIRKPNLHKMESIPVFKNDSTTQTSIVRAESQTSLKKKKMGLHLANRVGNQRLVCKYVYDPIITYVNVPGNRGLTGLVTH